jgi:hypothetical protein
MIGGGRSLRAILSCFVRTNTPRRRHLTSLLFSLAGSAAPLSFLLHEDSLGQRQFSKSSTVASTKLYATRKEATGFKQSWLQDPATYPLIVIVSRTHLHAYVYIYKCMHAPHQRDACMHMYMYAYSCMMLRSAPATTLRTTDAAILYVFIS